MSTLADLQDHITAQAPPPPSDGDLRRRRTRRRRRRGAVAGSVAVLVVTVAGLAVARNDTGETVEVATATDPTGPGTTPSPSTSVSPSTGVGLTITPTTPLVDQQKVTLTLDPAPPVGTRVWVEQCGTEVLPLLGTGEVPTVECGSTGWNPEVAADGTVRGPWATRSITTARGARTDCAEAVGRCLFAVRVGDTTATDDRWVPLEFAAGTPLVRTTARLDPATGLVDGTTVTVAIDGLAFGDQAHVLQCRATAGFPVKEDCHQENWATSTPGDVAGHATATITVHRTIPTDAVGPVTCGDCTLWVTPIAGFDQVVVPLAIAP